MPCNLVRYQQTGRDLHFVTFSCHGRQANLGTTEARVLLEKSLETMRLRYGFWITGYVVMPEHVHLLVGEPPGVLLSKVLQALKLSVAVQRRERPFWQARYYDFNVYSEKKLRPDWKYARWPTDCRGLPCLKRDMGHPELGVATSVPDLGHPPSLSPGVYCQHAIRLISNICQLR